MLRYGIPNYRLPEKRLDRDIKVILEWGVKFQGNTTVGKDIPLDQLKKDYDAIFLAGGANASTRIPLKGAEKKGVLWGWDFLKDVKLGKAPKMRGDVVVVGGGNVAIDVALTAKRLSARMCTLLSERGRDAGHGWEIALAEEEGVFINTSWAPKKVLGEASVTGLRLMKCTSVFDSERKFNPTYDEKTTRKIEARTVILAVGQTAELGYLSEQKGVKVRVGRIEADEENLSTGKKGILPVGTWSRGPASIIQAYHPGQKAAAATDLYLGGDGNIEEILARPEKEVRLAEFTLDGRPRSLMPLLKMKERTTGFGQVERGFTDEQIAAETNRCLNCDARKFEVVLNTEYCKECGYCAEVCGVNTFAPAEFTMPKDTGPRRSSPPSGVWGVICRPTLRSMSEKSRREMGRKFHERYLETGNFAITEGAILAGCRFWGTRPQPELAEAMSLRLPQEGGVYLQAEDECAAMHMCIGAALGGLKAMTATSGPGFILYADPYGWALGCETPLVVLNSGRVGPVSGITGAPGQGEFYLTRYPTREELDIPSCPQFCPGMHGHDRRGFLPVRAISHAGHGARRSTDHGWV
jgi:thioredoxin reductase/ferredoxin